MKKIAITMGDPGGIGPEIILKALADKKLRRLVQPLIIGDTRVIEKAIKKLKSPLKVKTVEAPCLRSSPGMIELMQVGHIKEIKKAPNAPAGHASAEYIKKAVQLALENKVDAICTAPISKEALKMAGIKFPGHTEMLASLTNTKEYAMMLVGGPLKVILATTHAPIKKVPSLLNRKMILEKIILSEKAGKMFGIKRPKIAVCGLNPHAGEGGALGSEEKEIISPAVSEANRKGINVSGPWPADSLFRKAYLGQVDVVLAMYHDQGLVPLKMIAFDTGVNITVGLPFIRTSPDHGTAFDIAWKGIANPGSMTEAIKTAAVLRPVS